jgi:hypothetical protein
MNTEERARAMRAEGWTFDAISKCLGISSQWAYKCANEVDREPRPTAATVVRRFARNGGCSTTSGMVPVSMPRIAALHGVFG